VLTVLLALVTERGPQARSGASDARLMHS